MVWSCNSHKKIFFRKPVFSYIYTVRFQKDCSRNYMDYALLLYYYCLLTVFLIRVIVPMVCSVATSNSPYFHDNMYVIAENRMNEVHHKMTVLCLFISWIQVINKWDLMSNWRAFQKRKLSNVILPWSFLKWLLFVNKYIAIFMFYVFTVEVIDLSLVFLQHWYIRFWRICKFTYSFWLPVFRRNPRREISWWKRGSEVTSDIQNSRLRELMFPRVLKIFITANPFSQSDCSNSRGVSIITRSVVVNNTCWLGQTLFLVRCSCIPIW